MKVTPGQVLRWIPPASYGYGSRTSPPSVGNLAGVKVPAKTGGVDDGGLQGWWNENVLKPVIKTIVIASILHFEVRDALNKNLPAKGNATNKSELESALRKNGWILLSVDESKYHDNGDPYPELKFVNPDGREVVYDGKTLEIITDPRYKGTYNYVTYLPFAETKNLWDFASRGVGHFVLDMLPYYLFDSTNERSQYIGVK